MWVLVSRFAANTRGVFHSTEKVDTPRIVLPTNRVLAILDRIAVDNEQWQRLGRSLSYLRVDYEDYVGDLQAWNRRKLKFLQVDPDVLIKSSLVKLTPSELRAVIANYDEVVGVLRGTPYEHMLEEN